MSLTEGFSSKWCHAHFVLDDGTEVYLPLCEFTDGEKYY